MDSLIIRPKIARTTNVCRLVDDTLSERSGPCHRLDNARGLTLPCATILDAHLLTGTRVVAMTIVDGPRTSELKMFVVIAVVNEDV